MTNKEIRINVTLDDKNIPEKIIWNADDTQVSEMPVRAMMLAFWDHANKDTLRLDLWTKDMSRDEMKIFFYETLKTMADTLGRSIDDDRIAGDMRDFCSYFAEKMDIIDKPDS
ncbi:MAG: gliding motility protein GldC [Cyclonatronaceae bacterium]